MEFDLEHPLASPGETIDNDDEAALSWPASLFYLESQHMVSESYAESLKDPDFENASMRRDAIAAISNMCCGRFGRSVSYLAVNYLDRFFSAHGVTRGKKWVGKLVAVACVSLAAKMMNNHVVVVAAGDLLHVQGEEDDGFTFSGQTIEKMEMVILGALNWRMRSITPFSFLNPFISLLNNNNNYNDFVVKDPEALKSRALEIIFKTQTRSTKVLEFNPSVVAASALLSACHQLFPMQLPSVRQALLYKASPYLDKENLGTGMATLLALEEGEECEPVELFVLPSRSDTPANVLDRQWSGSSSCCCCSDDHEQEEQHTNNNNNRNAIGNHHHHHHHHDSRDNSNHPVIIGLGINVTAREAKRRRSNGSTTDSCFLYSPEEASPSSSSAS